MFPIGIFFIKLIRIVPDDDKNESCKDNTTKSPPFGNIVKKGVINHFQSHNIFVHSEPHLEQTCIGNLTDIEIRARNL